MLKTKTVLVGLAMILLAGAGLAQESALDVYLRDHPAAMERGTLGPLEARLLAALTPEQAEAYGRGEDPAGIVLADGSTLAELLSALLAGGAGLVYVPLDTCTVFRTFGLPAGAFAAGESRKYFVRGTDLSAQGGSATGCMVPAEAVAVVLNFRAVLQSSGLPGRVRAKRVGGTPLAQVAIEHLRSGEVARTAGTSVVGLCEGACAMGDIEVVSEGVSAYLYGAVLGFFRKTVAADVPEAGDADTLDGMDASDFALAAHTHDGGDITSGTVGEPFIDSLIARLADIVPTVLASDGAGSGLDGDLLDGRDSADFMLQVGNCLTVSASCPAGAAEALAARCWQTISAALGEIGAGLPAATAADPYLIKVGPGTYAERVFMLPFVDIEGSGQKVTTITDDGSVAPGTVLGADDAELRNLTVESTGPAAGVGIAFHTIGKSPTLRQVTLRASGGANNVALVNSSGSVVSLVHVTASAAAETVFDAAVENQTASIVIRDSVLEGDDSALLTNTGATSSVVNTQLLGPANETGGGNTISCLGAYDGTFTELDANCQ